MKNFKLFISLAFFSLLGMSLQAQDIRFFYTTTGQGGNTGCINFFAQNDGAATQDLVGITIYFYYDETEATVSSVDFTPITGGAENWGTANESVINHQGEMNGMVPITHTGYFFYQNFDQDFGGGTLTTLDPGESILLGKVTYDNSAGTPFHSQAMWMAETEEVPPMAYTDMNFNAWDVIVTGPQEQVLPIDLTTFTVKKLDNSRVGLRWTTSSEINSSHFDVEKSKDGVYFDKIGEVRAAGNSNVTLEYTYIDDVITFNNTVTTYYYRLKMVDLDGQYEYSNIKSASFGGQSTNRIGVFPNPATDRISIETSGIEGEMTVQMIDMAGSLVYKVNLSDETTIHDIYLDETIFTPGTYFVQIIQENNVVEVQKVIVMNN